MLVKLVLARVPSPTKFSTKRVLLEVKWDRGEDTVLLKEYLRRVILSFSDMQLKMTVGRAEADKK